MADRIKRYLPVNRARFGSSIEQFARSASTVVSVASGNRVRKVCGGIAHVRTTIEDECGPLDADPTDHDKAVCKAIVTMFYLNSIVAKMRQDSAYLLGDFR
jgi:hypothetical protein